MQSLNSRARKLVLGLTLIGGAILAASSSACTVTVANCPGGETDCGGYCRDLSIDDYNCGACGYTCPGGTYCSGAVCVAGSCTPDLAACSSDAECCTGICALGDGLCGCVNNGQTGCAADTDCCDPGAICSGGVCQ